MRRSDPVVELDGHWLLRDGDVLASLETARSLGARARGLLGRDRFGGALLIPHTRSVHTIGMRFPIDVAFVDGELTVLSTQTVSRHRMTRLHLGARHVVEAEAGAFERWGLRAGDQLEIKG